MDHRKKSPTARGTETPTGNDVHLAKELNPTPLAIARLTPPQMTQHENSPAPPGPDKHPTPKLTSAKYQYPTPLPVAVQVPQQMGNSGPPTPNETATPSVGEYQNTTRSAEPIKASDMDRKKTAHSSRRQSGPHPDRAKEWAAPSK
ncbi:hypothetical protein LOK49_LG13G00569 [Camellia lanceoleosa]|uniref:Uncharacterized protein n=1 Tax=Camellia lanceoleosa TaxID=1840588 RepID=A0ACC0FGZ5_9ERIC|nr:hypothetical protein LOK49_LG13G00569 [Camellia lanceoleosa]